MIKHETPSKKLARKEFQGIESIGYRVLATLSLIITIVFTPATIRHWINLHPSGFLDFLCLILVCLAAIKVVWNCISMLRNPRGTIFQIDFMLFTILMASWEQPIRSTAFILCSAGIGFLAIITFLAERYALESNLKHAISSPAE